MLTLYPASGRASAKGKHVWYDLYRPTEEEIAEVETATGLHVPSRDEISAIEASSRLQRVGPTLYLSTPMLVMTERPHISPVGFVLGKDHLITVRFDKFGAFETAAGNAEADDDITPLGVFSCVMESVVDRIADALEATAAELDSVSQSIFHHKQRRRGAPRVEQFQRQTLAKVGRFGEMLSQIRDVLLGISRIASFVVDLRQVGMAEDIAARLKAVKQDLLSLNDYEGHLANKVQFLLDAVLGFITISQNDIFKVMTVWSLVGIPPTLMAGIYGMNFKYMPELELHFGYPLGLGVILVSALIPLAWFKWKGWV